MIIGIAPVFVFQGHAAVLEQIQSMVTSIGRMQMPSPASIATYLSFFAVIYLTGSSLARA